MPAPQSFRNAIANLLDVSWDAWLAQSFNIDAQRIEFSGQTWKIYVSKMPGNPAFTITCQRCFTNEEW